MSLRTKRRTEKEKERLGFTAAAIASKIRVWGMGPKPGMFQACLVSNKGSWAHWQPLFFANLRSLQQSQKVRLAFSCQTRVPCCVLRRKRSNERWRSRPKLDESVWEHPRFTLICLKPADRIIYVLKPLRTQIQTFHRMNSAISSTIGILQGSHHSRNKESSVKGRKGQGGGWSKSSWGIMWCM